ncbi:MAG: excinuclease ABC subunit A, partial [Chitinophagales bacterium]
MEVTSAIKSPLELDPKKHIIIKDARVHNLKSIDVAIPRNKLVVITGVSGSGKSSLAIDTLYAEGQRRYVESLSSYARQFLMRMDKPEVEYIKGISPAIAIEQKVSTRSSRSTVGSLTEIYDYMRLLYARVGQTISPISGKPVRKHEVRDVVDFVKTLPEGAKIQVLFPYRFRKKNTLEKELELLKQKGFIRIALGDKVLRLKQLDEDPALLEALKKEDKINIVLDRLVLKNEEEEWSRLSDSVETAFFESGGDCFIEVVGEKVQHFSNRFELDGMSFEEPNPHFFNFNSPYGACPECEGFGLVIGLDEDLIVPDKNKSVYEGAIAPWRGEKMKVWLDKLVRSAMEFDFPIHRSYKHLNEAEKKVLWTGNKYFQGLNDFFKELEQQSYKIQYRVMLSRYRGRTVCSECAGSRLRKEAAYVKFKGKSIQELLSMPIELLNEFFEGITLNKHEEQIAGRLIFEIKSRLVFMLDVGLPYLTLNRLSSTLSGGETQRINLTRSLGSNLTDSLYILDEPSIGLHPRDTNRLINVLKTLRDLGNTVIVVEHEEEMMRAADHIIDMGPRAGHLGGEVMASGNYEEIIAQSKSLTGAYLSGATEVPLPKHRRKSGNHIKLSGVTHHNLK